MANRMLRDAISLLYEAVQAGDNLNFDQSSHFSRGINRFFSPYVLLGPPLITKRLLIFLSPC